MAFNILHVCLVDGKQTRFVPFLCGCISRPEGAGRKPLCHVFCNPALPTIKFFLVVMVIPTHERLMQKQQTNSELKERVKSSKSPFMRGRSSPEIASVIGPDTGRRVRWSSTPTPDVTQDDGLVELWACAEGSKRNSAASQQWRLRATIPHPSQALSTLLKKSPGRDKV